MHTQLAASPYLDSINVSGPPKVCRTAEEAGAGKVRASVNGSQLLSSASCTRISAFMTECATSVFLEWSHLC